MLSEYFSAVDFLALQPIILLTLFGVGRMLIDLLLDEHQKQYNPITALIGLAFAAYSIGPWPGGLSYLMRQNGLSELQAFRGAVVIDSFSLYFIWIFLISIAILLSTRYLAIEKEYRGEHYAIMLFATVGMVVLAIGMDLVTLFVGLELMVISVYILTGFLRRDRRSNE